MKKITGSTVKGLAIIFAYVILAIILIVVVWRFYLWLMDVIKPIPPGSMRL